MQSAIAGLFFPLTGGFSPIRWGHVAAVTDPSKYADHPNSGAWFDDCLSSGNSEVADIPKTLGLEDDGLWDVLTQEGRSYLVQKVWCQKDKRIAAFP